MLRRRLKARDYDTSEKDSSDSYLAKRRALCTDIVNLRIPQRLYMPGSGSLLDTTDTVVLADKPESVELWLPSALPSASRDAQCTNDLPQLEYRLRYDHAMKALHDIRQFLLLIKITTSKTQLHISNTQKTATRTRVLFERVKKKLDRATSTYRVSRQAIENLDPEEEFGPWKETLLVLHYDDVRPPGREDSDRRGLLLPQSWIWKTASQGSSSIGDPKLQAILRIEWCKAEERAKRYEEEIKLTVEDMRRTLASFECDAKEWEAFAASPPTGDSAIDEVVIFGTIAYANKQAKFLRRMAERFVNDWYHLLKTVSSGVPWLVGYNCPPENKLNRLVSNVKLYHPASYIPENEPCDDDDNASEVDDYSPDDETAEILQDTLDESL